MRSLTGPLSIQNWKTTYLPDDTSSSGLRVVQNTARLCTTNEIRNKTPIPAPAVGYSGAGFFLAGFVVLWRLMYMEAGQSKLLRVLGIVGIVAFIGLLIMRYEMFVMIMNDPKGLLDDFLDNPIEFTVYTIFWLLGFSVGGA